MILRPRCPQRLSTLFPSTRRSRSAACRQLCLCCQDSVAGYSPNVFANAERAWDGGNSMIHILGILFSTLGSGVLCAGMAKHQSRLVGRKLPPSTVRLMKFGGFVVLALALAIDASGQNGRAHV